MVESVFLCEPRKGAMNRTCEPKKIPEPGTIKGDLMKTQEVFDSKDQMQLFEEEETFEDKYTQLKQTVESTDELIDDFSGFSKYSFSMNKMSKNKWQPVEQFLPPLNTKETDFGNEVQPITVAFRREGAAMLDMVWRIQFKQAEQQLEMALEANKTLINDFYETEDILQNQPTLANASPKKFQEQIPKLGDSSQASERVQEREMRCRHDAELERQKIEEHGGRCRATIRLMLQKLQKQKKKYEAALKSKRADAHQMDQLRRRVLELEAQFHAKWGDAAKNKTESQVLNKAKATPEKKGELINELVKPKRQLESIDHVKYDNYSGDDVSGVSTSMASAPTVEKEKAGVSRCIISAEGINRESEPAELANEIWTGDDWQAKRDFHIKTTDANLGKLVEARNEYESTLEMLDDSMKKSDELILNYRKEIACWEASLACCLNSDCFRTLRASTGYSTTEEAKSGASGCLILGESIPTLSIELGSGSTKLNKITENEVGKPSCGLDPTQVSRSPTPKRETIPLISPSLQKRVQESSLLYKPAQ